MPTLLEISEDILALEALIDDCTTEDGELVMQPEADRVLANWFSELMEDRDRKLDNYGALVREMLMRAAARKEEMSRLAARVKADETKAKYLKQRLLEFLDAHRIQKIETRRYKFSCRGNGGLQPLDKPEDPTSLPEEYQRKIIEADAEAIRAALATGVEIPGCSLKPRGRHLQIN